MRVINARWLIVQRSENKWCGVRRDRYSGGENNIRRDNPCVLSTSGPQEAGYRNKPCSLVASAVRYVTGSLEATEAPKQLGHPVTARCRELNFKSASVRS